MGRVIDALIAYRVLKLLVTPFNKTKAYKFGIIDDKGKVLIKSKDFQKSFSSQELPKAREAYTLLIRFVFNLKRLFRKYDTSKELKSRLIINHIIVLANVFGIDAATTLLFFKIDRQHWPLLKTILVYLHYMPENDMTDIRINQSVMAELGKI